MRPRKRLPGSSAFHIYYKLKNEFPGCALRRRRISKDDKSGLCGLVWFGCVQETFAILRISSLATLINLFGHKGGEKSACNATEAVRRGIIL